MNPGEGELRGQLSDRIGLEIEVTGINNIKEKIQIMRRREEFENNLTAFQKKYKEKQEKLQEKIIQARKRIPETKINNHLLEIIAHITIDLGTEGHRSDITILKTAKTIVAYNKHNTVTENDLKEAITLVLGENKLLLQKIKKFNEKWIKFVKKRMKKKEVMKKINPKNLMKMKEIIHK